MTRLLARWFPPPSTLAEQMRALFAQESIDMAKPRLYAEDTRVPVAQSRAEIERLLQNHKAQQFGTAVDYLTLVARVQFMLENRVVRFTIALPDPNRLRGERLAQAERQRWRALLLVLKAKLEAVTNNITTFEQEFLAHMVMPNGQTVSEIVLPQIADVYATGRMKALNAAPEDK